LQSKTKLQGAYFGIFIAHFVREKKQFGGKTYLALGAYILIKKAKFKELKYMPRETMS
jgi:hypothetical protein